jgi:hypothetical protein
MSERLGFCWNCGSEIIDGHEDVGDWLVSHLCGGCDDGNYLDRLAAAEARADQLDAAIGIADLALTIGVSWAGFIFDHWDNDRDSKVGKCIAALNGRMPGYAPDTDAFHAYRRQVHEARREAAIAAAKE